MKPLFIRADGSSDIGAGHVMRMLALAHVWRKQIDPHVTFLSACMPDAIAQRIREDRFEMLLIEQGLSPEADAHASLAVIGAVLRDAAAGGQSPDTWLMADGYHFPMAFQEVVKAGGCHLAVADDNGENGAYVADVVLNQNLHAHEAMYRNRTPATTLLLGTRYVLLRPEFLAVAGGEVECVGDGLRVLLTMGGADPGDYTGQILYALRRLVRPNDELTVLVGPSNRRAEHLEERARAIKWRSVGVARNALDMPALLRAMDIVVTAGGSTCWELCFLGVPMIAMTIAINQCEVVTALAAAGAAVAASTCFELPDVLDRLMTDETRRKAMAACGRSLVDGHGAARVASALNGEKWFLRPAQAGDARLLWTWVNEPEIRAASFSPDSIPWESHVRWFENKRNDPGVVVWIAEIQSEPSGVVRFEPHDGDAVISVSLAKGVRGRGAGRELIEVATRRFATSSKTQKVHAFIKADNERSQAAFEYAGYRRVGVEAVRDVSAWHYIWSHSENC